jgi:arylformamidase
MSEQTNWIDISVPLRTGMVHWPGDPEPSFERILEIEHGSEVNVTLCRMTAHTGTHMDAPCHFLPVAMGIDRFPIETGIGRARVISISPECSSVGRTELENRGIRRGDRLLLKTRNSDKRWDNLNFQTDFVAINSTGAQFLAEAGVSLVGVDYLSVGGFQSDGAETHRHLLMAGIWIVEGLDLTAVDEGEYELVCLPLRIEGSDGSPARVVLRSLAVAKTP